MSENEEILASCRKNLLKDRAVATGVGLFSLVIDPYQKVLLRNRVEKYSLFKEDLSGKRELPGGGVDLGDFPEEAGDYQGVILNTLSRELEEETGLKLLKSDPITLLPAWLRKDGLIDLAFVTVVNWRDVRETKEFMDKCSTGEIEFFPMKFVREDIRKEDGFLNIVSPRMRFLIGKAIDSVFCRRG